MLRGVVSAVGTIDGAGAPAKERRRKPECSLVRPPALVSISLQNGVFVDAGGGIVKWSRG